MGSEVHLIAVGPGATEALGAGEALVHDLEARWSRFRPDSELSQLNRAADRLVVLSGHTYELVERAVDAWWSTGGLFDPTVLDVLEASGYDRTFDQVDGDGPAVARPVASNTGCAAIELVPTLSAVRLPRGVRLDLGGIGKGRAADLVAEAMIAAGAEGACANLGGDLRVIGEAPVSGGWVVDVDDRAVVALASGAVATSSRAKRRWVRGGEEHHHLIDPRTATAARSGLVSVSVVAADATTADVVAKSAFVAGPREGALVVERAGLAALFDLGPDGVERVGPFEQFEVQAGSARPSARPSAETASPGGV
jgi:thiamine biosynthesis lipoprotein